MTTRRATLLAILLSALNFAGCRSVHPPIALADDVDLERFMGDWYVIANIPTRLERDAYGAVESYRLEPDGTVATTFTFRKGGFDGERKQYTPRGFVRPLGIPGGASGNHLRGVVVDLRVHHRQRREHALCKEGGQRHPADFLDDAGQQHVVDVGVVPLRAGLELQ